MAYIAADAILQRLRELLQDGGGSIRAISSARLAGNLPPGLSPEEQRRRGCDTSKPIEVSLDGVLPHPNRLTSSGSVQIHTVPVTVRVVRTLAVSEQVDDTLRDDVRALAIEDSSAIQDVLSWPNNLATTDVGAISTGIKGADFVESRARVQGVVGAAMDVTTEHRFNLTVVSTPATS